MVGGNKTSCYILLKFCYFVVNTVSGFQQVIKSAGGRYQYGYLVWYLRYPFVLKLYCKLVELLLDTEW